MLVNPKCPLSPCRTFSVSPTQQFAGPLIDSPRKQANMAIRIQPREIEVPENDPFRHDLLGRRESVEVLTHLVSSLEGPCVLAVDAAWGNGKTTFLRIWAQYLRKQEFPIVTFNAWETDFSGDPFVALSTEVTGGLQEYTNESMAQKVEETKERAKEVLRRAIPGAVRLATAGILDINPLLEKEVGNALASYTEERLSAYQQAQESVKQFRDTLQGMADAVSKSKGDRPLIVMIDELDRCRPSYAVELLEVAKHLFAVDHIVFVLAVNRSELSHSIKALYGNDFDAQGYLSRFFDVDFRLPEPDRKKFIAGLIRSTQIDSYFERTKNFQVKRSEQEPVQDLLQDFFGVPALSLRQVAQALHHLGLVFASLRSDERSFEMVAAVALILRTFVPDLYYKFCRGEISDLNLVEVVFDRPGAGALRGTYAGVLFESAIVASAFEISGTHDLEWSPSLSRLWDKHTKTIVAGDSGDAASRKKVSHANKVIHYIEIFRERFTNSRTIGFGRSVERIELLSPGLIREPEVEKTSS